LRNWDQVTAIVIASAKEEDCIVTDSKFVKQLVPHLDQMAEVTGTVRPGSGHEKLMAIEDFELLGDDDDQEDGDDDSSW